LATLWNFAPLQIVAFASKTVNGQFLLTFKVETKLGHISNFLTLEIHNNSVECVCVLVEMLFPLVSLGVCAAGLLFISDVQVKGSKREADCAIRE